MISGRCKRDSPRFFGKVSREGWIFLHRDLENARHTDRIYRFYSSPEGHEKMKSIKVTRVGLWLVSVYVDGKRSRTSGMK
jgi:hypothetical protein